MEAHTALAAARRGRRLDRTQHADAVSEFGVLVSDRHIVSVTDELVVSTAELAAALTSEATVFSSADTDLRAAAARRGLHVANPLAT